jgi:hypothetical protein
MRRLLLFLIGFAAPPGLIAAQQPDSVTLGKLQTRLAGRTRVRVMVATGRIEMRGPTLDTEGVRDGSDPTSPIVPWTAIARLQVRSSSFWTGAGFGWGAGFFVGMVAGMSSDDAAKCERYGIFAGACRRGGVDQTVVGVVGGALAGALLGGLIAAPFGRWSTVYQAPSRLTMPAITLRPTTSGGIVVVARIAF